jgi:hypothetical protein
MKPETPAAAVDSAQAMLLWLRGFVLALAATETIADAEPMLERLDDARSDYGRDESRLRVALNGLHEAAGFLSALQGMNKLGNHAALMWLRSAITAAQAMLARLEAEDAGVVTKVERDA